MILRNYFIGIIIFAALISLLVGSYHGLEDNYDIQRTGDQNGKNIMERLDQLSLISAINQSVSGIYTLKAPNSNLLDVLGGLASVGIGALKIIGSTALLLIDIIGVITGFYYIPPIITVIIPIIIIVYIAFLLLSAYIRSDL